MNRSLYRWKLSLYATDSFDLLVELPHEYSTKEDCLFDGEVLSIPGASYCVCVVKRCLTLDSNVVNLQQYTLNKQLRTKLENEK